MEVPLDQSQFFNKPSTLHFIKLDQSTNPRKFYVNTLTKVIGFELRCLRLDDLTTSGTSAFVRTNLSNYINVGKSTIDSQEFNFSWVTSLPFNIASEKPTPFIFCNPQSLNMIELDLFSDGTLVFGPNYKGCFLLKLYHEQ